MNSNSFTNLRVFGLIVGFFSAGLGIGGGAILVPVLVSLCHFDFKRAAGTSLATIIPISLVGAISHIALLKQNIHFSYFLEFVPACIAGAIISGSFLKGFNTRFLKLAFALFILLVGLKMTGLYDLSLMFFNSFGTIDSSSHLFMIMIFGIIAGFIAVMLGVGCGLIIVPFFVYFIGTDIREAIMLSLVAMFFLTSTATIVYGKCKTLDKLSAAKMLPSALIGAIAGAIVSNHLPSTSLKLLFGVFLLTMATKFLLVDELLTFFRKRKVLKYEQEQLS